MLWPQEGQVMVRVWVGFVVVSSVTTVVVLLLVVLGIKVGGMSSMPSLSSSESLHHVMISLGFCFYAHISQKTEPFPHTLT